ncbi:CHAT domain-containing protein [Gordonia alkaliphila]|uniref:CHAT domain-containing protein n=1 Tax=Gordonia alkaliphila TaxID=1053547 RepID=A0ABP8ZKK4_9ACTN
MTAVPTGRPTAAVLLVRAFDADATYLSFRWIDDPDNPQVHVVEAGQRDALMRHLDAGLIGGSDEQTADQARQAVTGMLTDAISEEAMSRRLGRVLLPARVRRSLVARAADGAVRVQITPSRALARVPWELLVVDDHHRLIELADVVYEPPAAIHVGRSRLPEPWSAVQGRPVCYLVDPRLPSKTGMGQVLWQRSGSPAEDLFLERIEQCEVTAGSGIGEDVNRWELQEDLAERPRRLFYFGHVSSTLDQPGSSSLHIGDTVDVWGLAEPMNDAHRPLSALDLLLGTSSPELGPDELHRPAPPRSGAQLWPMPPRVALIACEGGADYRSSETFGLVTVMFSAGAEVVVTTRWALPSDRAFAEFAGVTTVPGPTLELALAVDLTQEEGDPAAALARWQRGKLEEWRAAPGPATSPLTWAAVGAHVCPPRSVVYREEI